MASVTLKNVFKTYEIREKVKRKKGEPKPEQKVSIRKFNAVEDFNLEIQNNEFIVFVGPSGCGKSTTLRMIAGLEEISSGEIYIGDKLVNDVEPKDRDIAMVFQNYALYPHMSVYDNISLGLKLRKIPDVKRDKEGNPVLDEAGNEIPVMRHYTKQEIDDKVMNVAELLDIKSQLQKKPKEMSGGQRQRVALGRAMVRNPKVFLLDEPLSNLDAKLRTAMRAEISMLHKKLQTTFIYVTHDQIEAMTMGDRIVVMKAGIVQQIDTPNNLFDYPANMFVAGFIGTPQMNFFKAALKKNGKGLKLRLENGFETDIDCAKLRKIDEAYLDGEEHGVVIGVRGEHIGIAQSGIPFTVKMVEALGSESHVFGAVDGVADASDITLKIPQRVNYSDGDKIFIRFDEKDIHLFDAETQKSILATPEK